MNGAGCRLAACKMYAQSGVDTVHGDCFVSNDKFECVIRMDEQLASEDSPKEMTVLKFPMKFIADGDTGRPSLFAPNLSAYIRTYRRILFKKLHI